MQTLLKRLKMMLLNLVMTGIQGYLEGLTMPDAKGVLRGSEKYFLVRLLTTLTMC